MFDVGTVWITANGTDDGTCDLLTITAFDVKTGKTCVNGNEVGAHVAGITTGLEMKLGTLTIVGT